MTLLDDIEFRIEFEHLKATYKEYEHVSYP